MDIHELSKKIHDFQRRRFLRYGSEVNSELMFTHLVEEIGEIARQLFNKGSNMRNFDESNLREEIAQAILDLLVLAELNGIDLEKEIERKLVEMEKR